jgi:hypothetical protein
MIAQLERVLASRPTRRNPAVIARRSARRTATKESQLGSPARGDHPIRSVTFLSIGSVTRMAITSAVLAGGGNVKRGPDGLEPARAVARMGPRPSAPLWEAVVVVAIALLAQVLALGTVVSGEPRAR